MLNNNPGTFTLLQIHHGDPPYNTTWGNNRWVFYGVGGYPTAWFDGVIERIGFPCPPGYGPAMNSRKVVPTDVTIELVGKEVGAQTYEVTATVCLEEEGAAKTMRIYMVQVLDHWPNPPSYSRHGFKQAVDPQDITLNPGECAQIVDTFTFDTTSWNNQADIKIICWAQEPFNSEPAEVHQAAQMDWPFPEPIICGCGDIDDSGGPVDLADFGLFALCYNETGPTVDCTQAYFDCSDLDGDGWVSLLDFGLFALWYGSTSSQSPPDCAP